MTDGDLNAVDGWVAENVRAEREAAGMSQDDLAARMRDAGFPFAQATVWKIEQGQRPVRVAEARALGEILTSRPGQWTQLVEPPRAHAARIGLRDGRHRVFEASRALEAATHAYLDAVECLDLDIARARELVPDEDRTGMDFENTWRDITPEVIVDRACAEYEAKMKLAGELDNRTRATKAPRRRTNRKGS